MFLRALGSLLTRRFSPRTQAQAQGSPRVVSQGILGAVARRPARSLHTLRDVFAGDGALGSAAVAACLGLVGSLYLQKDTDDSADEEPRKDVPDRASVKEGELDEAAMKAMFVDKDRKDVFVDPSAVWEAAKRSKVKDEPAMKARFEEWIQKYGKVYKDEAEKARRYEAFKVAAMCRDLYFASELYSGPKVDGVASPNGLGDRTEEELLRMHLHRGGFDWEEFLQHNTSKTPIERLDEPEKLSRDEIMRMQIMFRAAAEARSRADKR